jgi:hypothetical protein|tara:strand:+ start:1459 stop:1587 length:129 start_codon:yes stop_codon:yes gene_type:complete
MFNAITRVDKKDSGAESMEHVLIYSDSLTWGIIPKTRSGGIA